MFRQLLIKIIFCTYLSAAYFNAIHLHIEEHEHECKNCLLVKYFQGSDLPRSERMSPEPGKSLSADEKEKQYTGFTLFIKGFHATAPPVVSSCFTI
jgi:hypothetical protein